MPKPKTIKKEVESKEVESPKPEYHLEVTVNDAVFKTEAESLEQALTNFVQSPEFPHGSKTKLIMKYGKGTTERTRIIHTVEARRLLTTISIKPDAIKILAEQLTRSLEA